MSIRRWPRPPPAPPSDENRKENTYKRRPASAPGLAAQRAKPPSRGAARLPVDLVEAVDELGRLTLHAGERTHVQHRINRSDGDGGRNSVGQISDSRARIVSAGFSAFVSADGEIR